MRVLYFYDDYDADDGAFFMHLNYLASPASGEILKLFIGGLRKFKIKNKMYGFCKNNLAECVLYSCSCWWHFE